MKATQLELSVESLLEEIKNNIITLQYDSNTKLWSVDGNDEYMHYLDCYGTSPKLALLALKEKLKTT